jgi:hypothetical protein
MEVEAVFVDVGAQRSALITSAAVFFWFRLGDVFSKAVAFDNKNPAAESCIAYLSFSYHSSLLRAMTRDVYLIIYKSRLYASHWAVFVPNATGHHDDGTKAVIPG